MVLSRGLGCGRVHLHVWSTRQLHSGGEVGAGDTFGNCHMKVTIKASGGEIWGASSCENQGLCGLEQ